MIGFVERIWVKPSANLSNFTSCLRPEVAVEKLVGMTVSRPKPSGQFVPNPHKGAVEVYCAVQQTGEHHGCY